MSADLTEFVVARCSVESESGCWNWNLARDKNGYGKAKVKQKDIRAHRLSWIAFRGEIPIGILVCHKCDNPSCVNPDHLFLGSPQANMDDKVKKGRWRGGPDCWDKSRLGAGHHKAKLNEEKVLAMREMLKDRGISEVARFFQVSAGAVYAVKTRRTWAGTQGAQL